MIKLLISVFLFCLSVNLYSSAKPNADKIAAESIEELQQKLEAVLKEAHVPGMSVALVGKEGPEWVTALGVADVANQRAASADTLFRIGSTSKAFAALAVLKLVEEGKVSLQDPVHQLVPEVWFENRWEESHPIRIVHLLEHTTGWDDMHLREYAVEADPHEGLREAFDFDRTSRISRWQPGTRMAYCNSGPPVAAYIVEKITGQKFEDYVAQNFFQPIGMKTATYFQPSPESTTILYHSDGTTPYPYWNIMYRPSGSINASARDMANYLLFYLNRGSVGTKQILPASSITRMESPTSTWAAEEGLKAGYGLGNYWSVFDGFVYHGHNGGMDGGLTEMGYMSDEGVGYFFSINSASGDAYQKIGTIIRAYLARNLQKPPLPPEGTLPANADEYTGWYEPNSPRVQMMVFMERLLGLAHLRFEDNKLLISGLGQRNITFIPVTDAQFRYVPTDDAPAPIASMELLNPNVEGKFVQLWGMATVKRVPSWLAITEIILTGFVLLSMGSILLYAPFWIFGGLSKKRRRPRERFLRLWPLLAVLSLITAVVVFGQCSEDLIPRMGNLTGWSFTLFLTTLIFPAASAASVIALRRASKLETRRCVRIYSAVVTLALVIAAVYLGYWGIIGLRLWS